MNGGDTGSKWWRRRPMSFLRRRGSSRASTRAVARPEEPYGRRRVTPRGVTGTPPAGERRWLVPDVEGGRVPRCWWAKPPTPPIRRYAPREDVASFCPKGAGGSRQRGLGHPRSSRARPFPGRRHALAPVPHPPALCGFFPPQTRKDSPGGPFVKARGPSGWP